MLEFLMDIRYLADEFREAGSEQFFGELLVQHSLRQRPYHAAVRCSLQLCYYGISGVPAA